MKGQEDALNTLLVLRGRRNEQTRLICAALVLEKAVPFRVACGWTMRQGTLDKPRGARYDSVHVRGRLRPLEYPRRRRMDSPLRADIPKEELVKIAKKLLGSSLDLDFLLHLEKRDLETLVAAIREGVHGTY